MSARQQQNFANTKNFQESRTKYSTDKDLGEIDAEPFCEKFYSIAG
jgi:hypothetical protein